MGVVQPRPLTLSPNVLRVALHTQIQGDDICMCRGEEVPSHQHRLMQAENEPTDSLSIANIKLSMLEIHSATKTATNGRLHKMLGKSRIRFVHLNVDK